MSIPDETIATVVTDEAAESGDVASSRDVTFMRSMDGTLDVFLGVTQFLIGLSLVAEGVHKMRFPSARD